MRPSIFVVALFIAGCAGPGSSVRGPDTRCLVAGPSWPSVKRDYDRRLTLAVLDSVDGVARAERDALHRGERPGAAADALFRQPVDASGAFVGAGATELAERLRQTDCAVTRGVVSPTKADELYGVIRSEIAAERMVLGGGADASRR